MKCSNDGLVSRALRTNDRQSNKPTLPEDALIGQEVKNRGEKSIGVSVIIPAYNEETAIGPVVAQLSQVMAASGVLHEVIMVDDGSQDNSASIAKQQPGVTVIRHTSNQGYGAALKTGIRHAHYDMICITDADGTYPNDRIPALLENLIEGGYDMVVGARTGDTVKIPLLRRFPKWVLNKIANYLSGFKIPDINSGLRVMKKQSVERFFNILPDGFSLTTTITLAMLTNNMQVHYTPINYYHRKGKSKIRPIHDTLNFLQLIIRTSLYFNPLKVFIPLSLFLAIFAFLILFGSWLLFGKAMDVTFGVILMSAVMVLAIGMLADLIDKRIR